MDPPADVSHPGAHQIGLLVFVENQSTGLFLEEETNLAAYRLALGNILHAALAPAATAELITQIATELR